MQNIRHVLADLVPGWLGTRTVNAWRYLYSHAVLNDLFVETALQSTLTRFPEFCDTTALPYLERDRRLQRGFEEPDEIFRARLLAYLDAHRKRGNPYQLMRQIQAWCYPKSPRIRIVNTHGTWYTLNEDGSTAKSPLEFNWNWDDDTTLFARFWVIIYSEVGNPESMWVRSPVLGTAGETWGSALPNGEQATWGSDATLNEVRAVRELVEDWKSAHEKCPFIIISFDADAFDPTDAQPPLPDGTWGNYSQNVGGTQVPTRDDRAIYWRGPT